MECPECSSIETKIESTRFRCSEPITNRKRRCLNCGVTFQTAELYMTTYNRLAYRDSIFDIMISDESRDRAAEMVRGRGE